MIEIKDCLDLNFQDESNNIPDKPKKKFLREEYEKKFHKLQPQSIKMIETRVKKDNLNDILYGKGGNDEFISSKKQYKYAGVPSYETLKMNNKNILPLQNGTEKKNEYRRNILKKYNEDHFFTQGNDNKNGIEKSHKKVFHLNSHMGDILFHDNVPKGYDIYSTKPNEVNYKTLVNSLPSNYENIKKYGKKVYE